MEREEIRQILKARHGSVGLVAKAVGVGQSAMSMWLSGRSPSRRLDEILPRIAEAMKAGASVEAAIASVAPGAAEAGETAA